MPEPESSNPRPRRVPVGTQDSGHICIHGCIHKCIYRYIYIHMFMYMYRVHILYISIYLHKHKVFLVIAPCRYLYICTYICMYMYIYICVYVYVHIHITHKHELIPVVHTMLLYTILNRYWKDSQISKASAHAEIPQNPSSSPGGAPDSPA